MIRPWRECGFVSRRYRCGGLILGLIALVLVGSLTLNVVLFQRARNYYLTLSRLRLDPLGLDQYSAETPPHPAGSRVRAVFFGDSRAAQWSAPAGLDRYEFLNRGIGGQTSIQVLLRYDEHVRPLQPEVLIVQAGVNDLKTIPLLPGRKKVIVSRCEEALRQIVARGRESGAVVVLTTIFPTGEVPLERRPYWSADVAAAIEEVNAFVRAQSGSGVIVLDAHALLMENGTVSLRYYADQLHLNASGYERLNRALAGVLDQLNPS